MRISKDLAEDIYKDLVEKAISSDLVQEEEYRDLVNDSRSLLLSKGAWWHHRKYLNWLKAERRRRLEKLRGVGVFDKKAYDEGRLKW